MKPSYVTNVELPVTVAGLLSQLQWSNLGAVDHGVLSRLQMRSAWLAPCGRSYTAPAEVCYRIEHWLKIQVHRVSENT
jgi:hypothetical protein